ncbi:MAG: twin-arginine translocase subunit TatC [Nitrososphaerota archaeon]|nr:twin-arginine translocase subunit TatC [Nitrososphaerota archaeon]
MFSGRLPFAEHLEELRQRLKVVAYCFLIVFVLVVLFPANPLSSIQNPGQYLNLTFLEGTFIAIFLKDLVGYLLPSTWHLIAANGLGEGMEIYIVASLLVATVVTMPVIAYETYRFIDPALTEKERGLAYPFATSASVLFAVGVVFGFFVLAKYLVIFLGPFFFAVGITPPVLVDASAFYYVVFLIIGATGVSFTSPVFVYTLIRLQVVEADFFSKNRVIIWFIIWVVTGLFLTPDGGPLLDLVIFVPIVVMVEAAVALGRRSVRDQPPKLKRGAIVCPSCGKVLPRPMLFCEHCGRSIA